MEKYLFERLHQFNQESDNVYRDHWGSILNFIDDKRTVVNGEPMEPDKAFKL